MAKVTDTQIAQIMALPLEEGNVMRQIPTELLEARILMRMVETFPDITGLARMMIETFRAKYDGGP